MNPNATRPRKCRELKTIRKNCKFHNYMQQMKCDSMQIFVWWISSVWHTFDVGTIVTSFSGDLTRSRESLAWDEDETQSFSCCRRERKEINIKNSKPHCLSSSWSENLNASRLCYCLCLSKASRECICAHGSVIIIVIEGKNIQVSSHRFELLSCLFIMIFYITETNVTLRQRKLEMKKT